MVTAYEIHDLKIISQNCLIAKGGRECMAVVGREPLQGERNPKENPLRIICQVILYKFKIRTKECKCAKNYRSPSTKGLPGGHYFV